MYVCIQIWKLSSEEASFNYYHEEENCEVFACVQEAMLGCWLSKFGNACIVSIVLHYLDTREVNEMIVLDTERV
jgi:hypothetical protein